MSVYFVVNEPLKLDGNPTSSLKIGGNTVDLYNVENTSYQGDYVMTNSDVEGLISLEISFFDLAISSKSNSLLCKNCEFLYIILNIIKLL